MNILPNTHLTYIVEVISVEKYPEASLEISDYELERILYFW